MTFVMFGKRSEKVAYCLIINPAYRGALIVCITPNKFSSFINVNGFNLESILSLIPYFCAIKIDLHATAYRYR